MLAGINTLFIVELYIVLLKVKFIYVFVYLKLIACFPVIKKNFKNLNEQCQSLKAIRILR